jgi:hypothetical protein
MWDSVECHNKCPGGSPEAEQKCLEKCEKELAVKHARERRREDEMEEKRRAEEWRRTVEKQVKSLTHSQPPLFK